MKSPEITEMPTKTKESNNGGFKENAVNRAIESLNIAQTLRELDIKENTLYNCVYKYTHSVEPAKVICSDEHFYDELKRLKKEVTCLTEERDLLKSVPLMILRTGFAKNAR